jgi:hypothetical protein
MLDGHESVCGRFLAGVASGPYGITFHTNGTVGIAEGPARVVHLASVVKRKA